MLMAQVETTDETETRLLRVIAQARFEVLAQDYIWRRMDHDQPPSQKAIACVRDDEAWYEFLPAPTNASTERYRVVSFHFSEGTDAAGFVAWLATHLKRTAQTGSVVICGKDQRDSAELFHASQGVFDYWCCSVASGDRFVAVIRGLIDRGKTSRG